MMEILLTILAVIQHVMVSLRDTNVQILVSQLNAIQSVETKRFCGLKTVTMDLTKTGKDAQMGASQIPILFGNAKEQESSVRANQYVETVIKLVMKFVIQGAKKGVRSAKK